MRQREPVPRWMTGFAVFIAVLVIGSLVGNSGGVRAGLFTVAIALLIGLAARALYFRLRR